MSNTFKVRCINNTNCERNLKLDEIYDAAEDFCTISYYIFEAESTFYKNRFVIVNEEIKTYTTDDLEEIRLRKLLSPTILPHECPCGIARVACSYHR